MVFNTGTYTVLPDNSIVITANVQSETGFQSSHQLKSYVASKSRLKLAARAVLTADAGLLVLSDTDTNRHFWERVEIEIKSVKTGVNLIPSQHSLKYTFVLLSISKRIACPIITEDLKMICNGFSQN